MPKAKKKALAKGHHRHVRFANKLWVISFAYFILTIFAFAFNVPYNGGPFLHLLLLVTMAAAFAVILLWPFVYSLKRFRPDTPSYAIMTAAVLTSLGYLLLIGFMALIWILPCDPDLVPKDPRMHCNVSGKGLGVLFVLVPTVGAFGGLSAAVILFLKHRLTRSRKRSR